MPSCSPHCAEAPRQPTHFVHRRHLQQQQQQQQQRRGVQVHAQTQNKEFRPPRWYRLQLPRTPDQPLPGDRDFS